MNSETREQKILRLTQMAKEMRLLALDMALGAGNNGSHLGPAFSCMEILAALYGEVMTFDINNPGCPQRDRFIASKAHCVLAHYTALAMVGFFSKDELATFEKNGTSLAGHPAADLKRGIEYSGGSLGQALPFGIGLAIDARQKNMKHRIFILLGDGECDEGSNWEAFLAAPHYKLDNLIAIIDKNKLQYDGATDEVMNLGDMAEKLNAFGWQVTECDGHNIGALLDAFSIHPNCKPYAIIANTTKGKGVSFMENVREWHHSRITKEQYDVAVAEVRGEQNA